MHKTQTAARAALTGLQPRHRTPSKAQLSAVAGHTDPAGRARTRMAGLKAQTLTFPILPPLIEAIALGVIAGAFS